MVKYFQKVELSVMLWNWEPTCEDKVLKGDYRENTEPGPSGLPTTIMMGTSQQLLQEKMRLTQPEQAG